MIVRRPPLHELRLLRLARRGRHLPVVVVHGQPELPHHDVQLVDVAGRRAVDDARPPQPLDQPDHRVDARVLAGLDDVERQVLAIRRARDDVRVLHPEEPGDVRADVLHRGGGQRHARRRADLVQPRAELEVRRPEVVTPLRDAVRLVDRGDRNAGVAERLDHGVEPQRLRRGHHQQRAALDDALVDRAPLLPADGAVQTHRRDVALHQLVELVRQEREQR